MNLSAELESLEQGIEKLRRAPDTTDASQSNSGPSAAYLEEMEVWALLAMSACLVCVASQFLFVCGLDGDQASLLHCLVFGH